MQPPEETASSTPRVERPDLRVLDNQGQPVGGEAGPGPHLAESRPPSAAVDARHVQGKVCYGILLFSNAHALSGRDPTCLGVPVRRPVPAPTPGSARLNAHQADVGFRFSCTGKATHVVQPPAKPGGKVVLPYCEGLEILASSQQVTDTVVSGRHAAQHEHGDAPTGRPQSPPLGDAPRGALPGPAAVLDLGAFYEKWKKSANKIAQRMQDNVEATVALLTGGGRRGG